MPRFSEKLLEHAQFPCNLGVMAEATRSGKASLDGNPPFIQIFLLIENDVISRSTFDAHGCGVTTAICSATTEMLIGKSLAHCQLLTIEDITSAVDGVPLDKHHCAHVCLKALRDAIKQGGEDVRA